MYLESNEIETAKILICEVLAIDTDYIKRYFDMSVCYDKNIIHFLLEEFEGCVDTNTEKIKNDLAEVEENISKLDVSKDNAKLSAALMSVKRIKDAMITFDNREREDARLKILELYNSLLRVEDDMEAQAVRIVQINEVKEQAFNILSALYKYAVHFKRGSTIEKEIDLYFEKMKSIIEINDNQEALDVFYKSLESFSSGFVEQINEFYVLQSAKIFKSKDNILNSTSRRMLDLIMCYFDYLEQMNLTQDDFLLNASVRRISS